MSENSSTGKRVNRTPRRSLGSISGLRRPGAELRPGDEPAVERMGAVVCSLVDVLKLSRRRAELDDQPPLLQDNAGGYLKMDFFASTALTRYVAEQLRTVEGRILSGHPVGMELELADGMPLDGAQTALDLHYTVPSGRVRPQRFLTVAFRDSQAGLAFVKPCYFEGEGNATFLDGITEALQADAGTLRTFAAIPGRNLLQ